MSFNNLCCIVLYHRVEINHLVINQADDLRKLLPKGFEVIGGVIVAEDSDAEKNALEAVRAARRLRKHISEGGELDNEKIVGASFDAGTGTIHFFISKTENSTKLEPVASVVYEDKPAKYLWENGCLLHCELPIKLPFYFPASSPSGTISVSFLLFFCYLYCVMFLKFSDFLFFFVQIPKRCFQMQLMELLLSLKNQMLYT